MPASYWDLVHSELRLTGEMEAERQRAAYLRRRATAMSASRISEMRRAYPHMGAGLNLATVKAGLTPNDPAAKQAAGMAAKRRAKKGVGWHTIGEVTGTIGRTAGTILKPIGRTLYTDPGLGKVLKPTIRTAFTVAQAPHELAQGMVRNIASEGLAAGPSLVSGQAFRQTTLYQSMPKALGGKGLPTGSGFFAADEAAEAQARAARAAYAIDGHAATPGRLLARTVVTPGTSSYNILSGVVDAALALKVDPASAGLKVAANARKASKLFVATPRDIRYAAGLVDEAHRVDVVAHKADSWLGSRAARPVLERMANETSVLRLYEQFGGPQKIPVPLLRRLADANAPEDVADVLREGITGGAVRAKPTMPSAVGAAARKTTSFVIRRSLSEVRMIKEMPGHAVDLDDADDVVRNLINFGRNVKAPTEDIDNWVDLASRSYGRNGHYNAYSTAFDETATRLMREEGVDKDVARKLTGWKRNYDADNARYFISATGENMPVLGARLDGADRPLPAAHMFNELIHRALTLPDARDLRRQFGLYTRLAKVPALVPALKGASVLLDFVQGNVWKTTALLRGAWTVRVIGEEQLRMAASGMASTFRHPISALAWIAGEEGGKLAKLADMVPGVDARGAKNLMGDPFAELKEFKAALSAKGSPEWWKVRQTYAGKRLVSFGDSDYVSVLADNLATYHDDALMRRVAGGWDTADADSIPGGLTGNHVEDLKKYFWEGEGRKIRLDMAQAPGRHELLDAQTADNYIDSLKERLDITTGGIDDLRDAVAFGEMQGLKMMSTSQFDTAEEFQKALAAYADDTRLPERLVGDRLLESAETNARQVGAGINKATHALFNALMTVPTNNLSRSPAFRQFYWQRVEELIPQMDAAAQARALAAAEEANLGGRTMSRLRKRAAASQGTLGLADADTVTKAFALDNTRDLLYDLTRRGQMADIVRHYMPFAEAWKEVLTRWAKIGTQNPAVFRRGQMIIQSAREADPFNEGHGMFYEDPQTGEEMFAFPGMETLTERTIGMPLGFKGPVAGLNLFSSNPLMPGFGPLSQVVASKVIPDTPDADWARKLFLPYGETDPEKQGGLVEAFYPAWFKKWAQAYGEPRDQAQFASTFAGAARYLASTGDYDLADDDEQRRLEDDAKRLAKRVFVFRSALQFFAPAPPSPEFMAHDKDGTITTQFIMVDRYRTLVMSDDPVERAHATETFIAEFGEKNLLSMQGTTEGTGEPTKDANDWIRRNPGLERKFPETYFYFGPQGGEFDSAAWHRLMDTGQRKPLSSDEFMKRANHRVGTMVYRQAQDKLPDKPTQAQRDWLKGVKAKLRDLYPGYDSMPVDVNRTQRLIRELESALDDPRTAQTDTGQAVRLYFEAREKALEGAKAKYKLQSFATSPKAKPLRNWLRGVADKLSQQHPDFVTVWERVLSHELADDD